MFNTRLAVFGAAMASSLAVGGCAKDKARTAGSQAPEATADAGGAEPATTPAVPAAPKVPNVEVTASFQGLGDMMEATKMVLSNVNPENAFDPRAQLGALLLASGFGPAFLSNIELDGVHAVGMSFPPEGGESVKALEFSGAFEVRNARAVLEAMPPSFQPQPLGDGSWELRLDDMTVLLQESEQELRVGLSPRDLAAAAKLDRQPSPGRRIRARIENLPTDQYNREQIPMLQEIPGLEEVIAGAKAMEVELDFGTERSAQFLTTAIAPFHRLGLDPLGVPRQAATTLEQRLPAEPFFAATMSWGDPALVHASIDRVVPLDQIPEPFGQIAKKAVTGVHGLLDQIANDVVFAVYVAPNGDSTLLVAADVKADAEAAAGLRMVSESVVEAIESYGVAQGNNENLKFKVEYKGGSVRLGSVKADRMNVRIPSDFRSDFKNMETFIKKDSIEVISWVSGQTAVLAVGAGAKTVSADVAKALGKARKSSLAEDEGLQQIRAAMGGCQLCASFDVVEYLKFRLQLLNAQNPKDAGIQKRTKTFLAALGKAKVKGEPSLGVRVEPERGAVGFHVPASLVFTEHDALETLKEANEYVDAGVATTAATP